jgi:hypothetical protein
MSINLLDMKPHFDGEDSATCLFDGKGLGVEEEVMLILILSLIPLTKYFGGHKAELYLNQR